MLCPRCTFFVVTFLLATAVGLDGTTPSSSTSVSNCEFKLYVKQLYANIEGDKPFQIPVYRKFCEIIKQMDDNNEHFDFHDLVDVEIFVKAAPKLLSVDYKETCNIETLQRLMAKLSGWVFSDIASKAMELSKSISGMIVIERCTVQWQANLETAEIFARYHYYMDEHGLSNFNAVSTFRMVQLMQHLLFENKKDSQILRGILKVMGYTLDEFSQSYLHSIADKKFDIENMEHLQSIETIATQLYIDLRGQKEINLYAFVLIAIGKMPAFIQKLTGDSQKKLGRTLLAFALIGMEIDHNPDFLTAFGKQLYRSPEIKQALKHIRETLQHADLSKASNIALKATEIKFKLQSAKINDVKPQVNTEITELAKLLANHDGLGPIAQVALYRLTSSYPDITTHTVSPAYFSAEAVQYYQKTFDYAFTIVGMDQFKSNTPLTKIPLLIPTIINKSADAKLRHTAVHKFYVIIALMNEIDHEKDNGYQFVPENLCAEILAVHTLLPQIMELPAMTAALRNSFETQLTITHLEEMIGGRAQEKLNIELISNAMNIKDKLRNAYEGQDKSFIAQIPSALAAFTAKIEKAENSTVVSTVVQVQFLEICDLIRENQRPSIVQWLAGISFGWLYEPTQEGSKHLSADEATGKKIAAMEKRFTVIRNGLRSMEQVYDGERKGNLNAEFEMVIRNILGDSGFDESLIRLFYVMVLHIRDEAALSDKTIQNISNVNAALQQKDVKDGFSKSLQLYMDNTNVTKEINRIEDKWIMNPKDTNWNICIENIWNDWKANWI